jgi:DEAD/DEAH box helicase domain-containing protein
LIDYILKELKIDENYHGQFVKIFELKTELPGLSPLPEDLNLSIKSYLQNMGIKKLYSHQIEAVEEIKNGENVIITTSTSSGKTLAFNIPIINYLLNNPKATALYIYPTKALAQDQFEKVIEMVKEIGINAGTYDGDTPQERRTYLRRHSRLLLINPDILHIGILPNHTNWSSFFSNLKFIVVDEAHYYSGVLGSHMSEIMRRLRRISHYYGSYPQFILASATLKNPEEFSFKLIGERFKVIGGFENLPYKKKLIILNPPLIDPSSNLRRSIYKEAVWILKKFLQNNVKTIAFVKSRKGVELVTRMLKNSLEPDEKEFVSSYRAGYTKETRHEIENKLKNGKVKIVITTNALELGIDIGALDATLIVGYPGSISSIFQQSGRSGRHSDSLSILITGSNPIDQYFAKDPDYIFTKNVESISINPENPYIQIPHLKCAAYEIPIDIEEDVEYFGNSTKDIVQKLNRDGIFEKRSDKYFYIDRHSVAPEINIRGAGQEQIRLFDSENNQIIERISRDRAIEETFKGAVYMHLADTYVVKELNLQDNFAILEKKNVDYYTDSLAIETIWIQKLINEKRFRRVNIYFGDVLVEEKVRGFVKKQFESDRRMGSEELDLPLIKFTTKAFWFTIEEEMSKKIADLKEDLPGTIHAVEHLLVGMTPLVVLCDRNDLGGVSHPLHPDTQKATIFVYDGIEGGIGLSEKGYERIGEIFEFAYKTVSECTCKDGCPSCIFSPKCGNENSPLSKNGAKILLKEILS